MKNTQLRRGNKVLHNGIEKTIDCISPGWVIFLEDRKETDYFGQWVDLDEVEFISIDKKRMLDAGFEIVNNGITALNIGDYPHHYEKNGVLIENLNKYGCFVFGYGKAQNIKLEYFHQVQNLYFALTNEEL